jgi:hypothetical protein
MGERLSARRNFNPYSVLWTIRYANAGDLRPYCPEYTGIEYAQGRKLLSELRAKYPGERLVLTPASADHLTVFQARRAMRNLFSRVGRQDALPAVRKTRPADVPLLASIAFQAERNQKAQQDLARVNEQRKAKGLGPVPQEMRAEPRPVDQNGYVRIHIGGAY